MYALQGLTSGDLITWGGKVLVHDNRRELEFLFIAGVRVVECPRDLVANDLTMPIWAHPEYEGLSWPLRRSEFVTPVAGPGWHDTEGR